MISCLQIDWRKALVAKWFAIPFNWRLAFFAALGINVLVFFFDIVQFPLGDHDVGYVDGIPLLSGGGAGRWFTPFLHILSGHVQIPVWTQLIALCCQIMAGMGAVLLWHPKARTWELFTGAIIVSCMPTVTDFYYYHYMAVAFTASQLFMVLALHFSMRQSNKRPYWILFAIVLVTCALASYQSSIMTWTTCFWGMILMRLVFWNGCFKIFFNIAWEILPALGCIVAGCLLYAVSLCLYPLVGLSLEHYQFKTIKVVSFFQRIYDIFSHSYEQFVSPQGFLSPWLTSLLFITALLGAVIMLGMVMQNSQKRGIRLLFFSGALILFPMSAYSQFLVSASESWNIYRFLALGMSYLYAFFLLALFSNKHIWAKNAGFALFVLILPCMAINCLDQQIRHVRQVEHDQAVLNRIIARIETLPEFNAKKTYNLVQLGRTKPYIDNNFQAGSLTTNATISQSWNPGFELRMLSKYLELGMRLNEEVRQRPDLMKKALEWVKDKKPFPAQDSIAIEGDTIFLFLDPAAIPQAEKRLSEIE